MWIMITMGDSQCEDRFCIVCLHASMKGRALGHWEEKGENNPLCVGVHSQLRSITLVATNMHVILRSYVVLMWMRDIVVLV